jgi:hypothetical protein
VLYRLGGIFDVDEAEKHDKKDDSDDTDDDGDDGEADTKNAPQLPPRRARADVPPPFAGQRLMMLLPMAKTATTTAGAAGAEMTAKATSKLRGAEQVCAGDVAGEGPGEGPGENVGGGDARKGVAASEPEEGAPPDAATDVTGGAVAAEEDVVGKVKEEEQQEEEQQEQQEQQQQEQQQEEQQQEPVWCAGTVERYDRASRLHLIKYDEGTEEMVDFGSGTNDRLGLGGGGVAASKVAWVPVGPALTHADANRGRRYRQRGRACNDLQGPGSRNKAATARLLAARRHTTKERREGLEEKLTHLCKLVLETLLAEEHAEVFAEPVDTVSPLGAHTRIVVSACAVSASSDRVPLIVSRTASLCTSR